MPLGLADMAGNLWAWCANYQQPYADLVPQAAPVVNDQSERAQRDGSFLREVGWCYGYRVSGRSGSTPETALIQVAVGFNLGWPY